MVLTAILDNNMNFVNKENGLTFLKKLILLILESCVRVVINLKAYFCRGKSWKYDPTKNYSMKINENRIE